MKAGVQTKTCTQILTHHCSEKCQMSILNKQNVVYPHNGILFNHKKEWSTDTCHNENESQKYAKWKNPDTKGYVLYEISRIDKSIKTGN